MDFRRFLQAARQHKLIVALITLLGVGLGIGYSVLSPPLLTSTALVEVQFPAVRAQVQPIQTQVLIADGIGVLQKAGKALSPPVSLAVMQRRVSVSAPTSNVLAITGSATDARQAENMANAVASAYGSFVASDQGAGAASTLILEKASTTKGSALKERILDGLIGFILGLLIGIAIALVVSRSDRRLRRRDEIADAIGIPVLASIPVLRPSDAAGWTRLLDTYEPAVVDAWSLRKALRQLGLTDFSGVGQAGTSLTVISLAGDRAGLALGPQIAVFVASMGIQTSLVLGPQQDPNATATLAAACGGTAATPSGRPVNMRLGTGADRQPGAAVTVVVTTVDGKAPDLGGTMRTTATVLGVSAGGSTAEQLARVAVNAASDGREITGILVADPDPTDPTTGSVPQPERPTHRRMPTRMPGAGAAETK
jgi:capsular polysaccharide biosynthesis protein